MTWQYPQIDHNEWVKQYNYYVSHPGCLIIEVDVDIGVACYIQAQYGVSIGRNTKIGGHCGIYSKNSQGVNGEETGMIYIGKNVSIGSHTLILPGSYIPNNTKIKAHSTVRLNSGGKTEVQESVKNTKILQW